MGKKTKDNNLSSNDLDCKPIEELLTESEFKQKLGNDIYDSVFYGNIYQLRFQITAEKNGEHFENIKNYLPLFAASKNQVEILRNFVPISSTASRDTKQRTALHYAAYNCHVAAVRFLLDETQLDHTLEDDMGYSAFQYACVGGDTDVMDLIMDKVDVNNDINNNREDISNPAYGDEPEMMVPSMPDAPMAPAARSMARAPARRSMAPSMPAMAMPAMAMPTMDMPAMAESCMPTVVDGPIESAPLSSMAMMRPMAPPHMGFVAPMPAPVQSMECAAPAAPPPAMGFAIPQFRAAEMMSREANHVEKKPADTEKKKNNIPKKFFLQSLVLAARRGNTKAVMRLLDDASLDEDVASGLGSGRNSLLHFLGRRISAKELSKLSDCGLDITSRNTSGVRAFEEVPPSVLQEFLDMSVSAATENIDENILESYTIKNPFLNQDHPNLDMTTLLEISNSTIHTKLIFHPLFFGICAIKWKYIRKIYWFIVFLSFLFAILTSWVTVSKVGDSYQETTTEKQVRYLIEDSAMNILICQVVTCCLLLMLVITEISNMLFHTLAVYAVRYLVIIFCVLSVLVLIFVFPVRVLEENAYFVIFIPWMNVMYHICQHYSFAQYYSNMVQIAKTSLKIIFVFGSLPIAFSIVFHIIMMKNRFIGEDREISPFDYIYSSVIKTIAMMMGDFSMEEFSTQFTNFQWSVTFLFFILGISLVLYNMINALAVSDTQKLNERAEIFRMVALTRQILSLQNWMRFFKLIPCLSFLDIPIIKDFTVNCKNYRWSIDKYTYETRTGAQFQVSPDIEIRGEEEPGVTPKYSLSSRCKHISVRCNAKFVDDLKTIVINRM